MSRRPVHRRTAVLAVLAAALLALSGCGASHQAGPAVAACPTPSTAGTTPEPALATTASGAPAVPSAGHAYLGAFTLDGAATQQNFVTSFTGLEQTVCRPLSIAHAYLRWRAPFPSASARELAATGHDLLVSWTGTDMAQMANGSQDAVIAQTARQIASLHHPVFLELRWEMDRPNLAGLMHSPATYVAAWRHTRAVFAAVGVPNVSWVWCPTSVGFATGRAQLFYPGDDEVDWVCTDAYPDQTQRGAYPSLDHLVHPFLSWAARRGKPAMIGEMGVPQSSPPAQRAAWLDGLRHLVDTTPAIRAAAYFDHAGPGSSPRVNYALGTAPPVVGALRRLAADPHLRPTG